MTFSLQSLAYKQRPQLVLRRLPGEVRELFQSLLQGARAKDGIFAAGDSGLYTGVQLVFASAINLHEVVRFIAK